MITSDWTGTDVEAYQGFCSEIGAPLDSFLAVWMNESGCRSTAWNRNGDASGIFQLMPSSAKDIGWPVDGDPHLASFRLLSIAEQIRWAARFYGPHKGALVSAGTVYVCTFLPVQLARALDPAFVVCGASGPFAWAYRDNSGFDPSKKGTITVQDLSDAAARALATPRGQELLGRVSAVG